jgi:hypothetical protein
VSISVIMLASLTRDRDSFCCAVRQTLAGRPDQRGLKSQI